MMAEIHAPFVRSGRKTQNLMADVLLALVPALAAGVWLHGFRALIVCMCSVGAALAMQMLWRQGACLFVYIKEGTDAQKPEKHTVRADMAAAVTGLLLGLSLPAGAPWFVAATGGAFAILYRQLCGGTGENALNPALAARALLMWLFPLYMTKFLPVPGALDALSGATPLHEMAWPSLPNRSLWQCFLGLRGGCIGEGCAPALLLGMGYLVRRGVTDVRVSAAYLGTFALLTLLFPRTGTPVMWTLYSLCSGGVLLGALFMATDFVTTPVLPRARILFGVLCGALTVLFRNTLLYPEGVTYAILLANPLARALDAVSLPKPFGERKEAGR